ncbi:uncharacterized protein [Mytilus edulis]|uniref:uncharacterized protein n=1 Tax=Mytilus edulis TaxID=6550 RepID=UPI0039EFA0BE
MVLFYSNNYIIIGSCPGGYYHCTGYEWCCPTNYRCTGTSRCNSYTPSYSGSYSYSYSYSYSSSSSGGAIAGGIVGGIFLVIILCCVSAAVKSKTGNVSRVIYPKRRNPTVGTVPKKEQPSSIRPTTRQNENYNISRMTLPGSYEPTNPPLTHHI